MLMATTPPAVAAGAPLIRCLAIYRRMPLRFAATAGMLLAVNLALVAQQGLVGRSVHEAGLGKLVVRDAAGGLDYSRAWFWVTLLLGLSAARATVQYGAGLLSLAIGQELLTVLRQRILIQVQRLDLTYHWRHGVGEMVTRMTRDADKVRDALINFWRQMFETGLTIVISVSLLTWYSLWLGIVPLALMVLGIALLAAQADALVLLDRRIGAAYDAVTQDLSEGVNDVRVIKAFGLGDARVARFDAHIATFRREARAAIFHASLRVPPPQAVIALGHAWVLGYGAWLVREGRLDLGALVTALLVVNTLVLRMESIGLLLQVIADARASAGRIWEVLDARICPRCCVGYCSRTLAVLSSAAQFQKGEPRMRLVIATCALLLAPAAVAQETTTYRYDALGRLDKTSTTGGQNNGTVNEVQFDDAGNRVKYTTTGATGTPSSGMKVIVVPLNGFTVIAIPNPWAAK